MYITWYGQSSFKLQTKEKSVLIDPYSPREVGLKCPRIKSDIIILSSPKNKNEIAKKTDSNSFLINEPGEYDVKGIFVYGLPLGEKIIYKIEFDDIHIGILGAISSPLINGLVEKLDRIDILLIPIGGRDVLNSDQAIKIIGQIEPKIIIPSCYKYGKMKSNLNSIKKFLDKIKATPTFLDKVNFKTNDFLGEGFKIVLLKPWQI